MCGQYKDELFLLHIEDKSDWSLPFQELENSNAEMLLSICKAPDVPSLRGHGGRGLGTRLTTTLP